jgi:predicted  nucleic acid-binding Zn-ribbon protein
VQSLAAALDNEIQSFNSKIKTKEEAAAVAYQGLQAELETARDDCDDLQKQLRLAERQLARLRRPKVQPHCTEQYTYRWT